ncbi:MAG: hypothetical protein FWC90_04560 [Oscillospiraceae bacterium]|nr:hypothetical protein [Oscillospiraceae bacterium]
MSLIVSIIGLVLSACGNSAARIPSVRTEADWEISGEAKTFSSGGSSSYAIQPDGALWAWGANHFGHLGDGTTEARLSPIKIMEDVTAVSGSGWHTMAIRADGSLWAWGHNRSKMLGDGTPEHRHSPVRIMEDVTAVSTGSSHTLAIRADGTLWAWGRNSEGQVGNGNVTSWDVGVPEPVQIMEDVVAVSAGDFHSMAIRRDGSLWAWGRNDYGQLGNGEVMEHDGTVPHPIRIMDNVAAVSAGSNRTFAIRTDGTLWAWGQSPLGATDEETRIERTPPQFGMPGPGPIPYHVHSSPILVMDNVASVATGGDRAFAVRSDGSLWAWGRGPLGDGTQVERVEPVKIMDDVAAVSVSYSNVMAAKTDGRLLIWGSNLSGQLGNGTSLRRFEPVPIMDNVTAVSTSFGHTMAIRTDGSLWGWGANEAGQLGNGENGWNISRPEPQKIMEEVVAVSTGGFNGHHGEMLGTTMAIRVDGTLWGWGAGPLGDGSRGGSDTPVKILEDVIDVSFNGWATSLAIGSDGSLYRWGYFEQVSWNWSYSLYPEIVADGAERLSGTLAFMSDGSIWGDFPVDIEIEDVKILNEWGNFLTALKTDGTLWIGEGSLEKIADNVAYVTTCSEGHILIIDNDSILWDLGWRWRLSEPVKIMEDVIAVSASGTGNGEYALAVTSDGTLWGWGNNIFGQLGDGTSERDPPEPTPTVVMESVMFPCRVTLKSW